MNNITHLLDEIYAPFKALIIYQSQKIAKNTYVEAYDIGRNGKLINAHPLSLQENTVLADIFDSSADRKKDFLKSEGILPDNVIYIDHAAPGGIIWHTPAQKKQLYFVEALDIPKGEAYVPALVWKATIDRLSIYAITDKKIAVDTPLFHAPFFNIYKEGNVCMGTVDIDIDTHCSLENFISQWEDYFWNSYFSHSMNGFCPVTSNIIQLWQNQVKNGQAFPTKTLIPTTKTLSDLFI